MLHAKFQNTSINIDRYFQYVQEGKARAQKILGMSPKKFRKISQTELEISLYLSNLSKEVSQLIDIQELNNHLELVYQNIRNISGKSERYLIPNFIYPYICQISLRK